VALATLNTTAFLPLIVRYPFSTSSIVVTCKSGNSKVAEARYLYFEISENSNIENLENEFHFNTLVDETKVSNKLCVLPDLKVKIKGGFSTSASNSKWEITNGGPNIHFQKLLGKRKFGQTEFESEPLLFGIVSTRNIWRWIGSPEKPNVDISRRFICNFEGDMQNEK
ncbi:12869_t:CDS:2, partial [Funneliformis caledonium]